jgi:hypothetical protein
MMGTDGPQAIEGGCHCGAVRYRVALRDRKGVVCNCSICAKKGFLHHIVDEADFELLQGRDALTTYTFGTRVAKHYFCGRCGVHSFYRPRSHPDKIDVNVRCLDGVSPDDFDYYDFDGRHWEESVEALRAAQRRQ